MKISADDIEKISHLARLQIHPKDIDTYAKDITRILDLVETMNDQDTASVAPMQHPQELTQRLREDQVTETDHHDKYQRLAKNVEAGLYLVPQVIE